MNYLQTKDCAKETICTPSYCNIFVGHSERKHMYPFIKSFSSVYLRFVDEIFSWSGNKKNGIKFLNEFNAKQECIKFEYQI